MQRNYMRSYLFCFYMLIWAISSGFAEPHTYDSENSFIDQGITRVLPSDGISESRAIHSPRDSFNMQLVTESNATVAELQAVKTELQESVFRTNNLWILLAAFLVFLMHLGFSMLESGLTRGKNTVNILFKNISIVAIGILTYAVVGFNLMYPGSTWFLEGWFGFSGFGLSIPEGVNGLSQYADGNYSYLTDFLFQAMFAATAATIISGAVAERIKIHAFLFLSIPFVGLVYPIIGSWKWGGGWLDMLGFYDFAGSTLVHSVGGWGALAAVILLGARSGKYASDGSSQPIFGDNIPLATIGMFLLWFGWYGFNGGSVFSADPGMISLVVVTTTISASAGILGSTVLTQLWLKKYDLSMILNGALAGLVGITAAADVVSIGASFLIGLVAGFLVVAAVVLIDTKLRLDDPVGAISVHLICGIWGTLAVGIFSPAYSLLTQFIGVLAYGAASFFSAFLITWLLKKTMGIRVSEKEELVGLDISEHGMEAYNGFQMFPGGGKLGGTE